MRQRHFLNQARAAQPRSVCAFALAVAAAMAGCATTAPATQSVWVARSYTDDFSDKSYCRVMPRELLISNLLPRAGLGRVQMLTFPYVEKRGAEIRVGIISGGGFQFPTGEVQMRIDDAAAWTIAPNETPLDTNSAMTRATIDQMKSAMAGTPQAETYERMAASMTDSVGRMVSPYTATTGEKAVSILSQMRQGQAVIYRGLGINAQTTSTGRMTLGADFQQALAGCGL